MKTVNIVWKEKEKEEVGDPPTEKEKEAIVSFIREKAKHERVFSGSIRVMVYKWMQTHLTNVYFGEITTDMGIVYYAVGASPELVEEYLDQV